MRRVTSVQKILSVVCFFCLCTCFPVGFQAYGETETAQETQPDFRQVTWGMGMDEVIAIEGEYAYSGVMNGLDAEYIAYQSSVAGLDAVLAYYFCDGGLYGARYILTEEHSNDSLFIQDYDALKEALTTKYGEPLLDNENWTDTSKKSYYANKKADALSYGYLSYETYFMNDRTLVTLSMSADNYDITTMIDFASFEISPGEVDYSSDF